MKKCNYCGAETADSLTRCPSCGGGEFSNICQNCGTIYDGNFCPKCGLKAGTPPRKCPNCGKEYYSVACPDCGFTDSSPNVAASGSVKKKYTWLWVLGWIFIFPLPLTILMLRNKNMKKGLRIGIIVAAWAIYLLIAIAANGSDSTSETGTEAPPDDVALTFSSYDAEGQQYEDIVLRFKSIGLTNIELVPIEDLITGWLTDDGEVEKVTINGDDHFYKGDKVKTDALIRISYHTFPAKETDMETVPVSGIVTVADTVPATEAVTERKTEKVTERMTEPLTETSIDAKFDDESVEKYIKLVLDDALKTGGHDVSINDSLVSVRLVPEGITLLAYRATELGDNSAIKEWNALSSTACQWSLDLAKFVKDDMNRSDLNVVLIYCHDLNTDNVLLTVMNGVVYYDFVNGIDYFH